MEWYIALSLTASAIGILCALLRLCLCSLACCAEDEENVAPLSYQTPEPYTIRARLDHGEKVPSSSPLPPPYPGDQFDSIKVNSNERPTPYTVNQSFARNNRGFQQ